MLKRVVALYGFEAEADDELSFRVDDVLIVSDDTNENWWEALLVRTGQNGTVVKVIPRKLYVNFLVACTLSWAQRRLLFLLPYSK